MEIGPFKADGDTRDVYVEMLDRAAKLNLQPADIFQIAMSTLVFLFQEWDAPEKDKNVLIDGIPKTIRGAMANWNMGMH